MIQCLEDGEGGIKGEEGAEKEPRVTLPSTDTRDKTNEFKLHTQNKCFSI